MATSNQIFVQVASSNAYQFTNASNNDVVMYQGNTAQQILVGTSNSTLANLSLNSSNISMCVSGATSNSGIRLTTNNGTNAALTILGTGCIGVGSASAGNNALLNIADYDGSIDPSQYGVVQIHHANAGVAGKSNQSSIAFVRNGARVVGLGYGKSANVIGFGTGTNSNTEFSPSLLCFDNTGKTGINTAAPTYPLDVNGAVRIYGVFNNYGNGGCHFYQYTNDDASRPRLAVQSFAIDNQGISFDTYYTGSNWALSSANTPAYQIYKYAGLFRLTAGATGSQGATAPLNFSCLVANSVGNVSIGTTNPAFALSVGQGNADTTNSLLMNTGDADKILLTPNGVNGSKISHGSSWAYNFIAGSNNAASGQFTFSTGSASGYVERVRIGNTGNVGIGSVAPQHAIDAVGNAQFSSNLSAANTGLFRNRIINGDMRFAQRGTSLATLGYGIDRFKQGYVMTGVLTQTQQTLGTTETPYSYGFKTSLRTTATTAVTAVNYIETTHTIEGYNIADLNWGSTSGTSATLSLWVKTNAASGSVISVSLRNAGASYSYVFPVTITTSGSWQFVTAVVPPPPSSSSWPNTNTAGASICVGGSGSGFATASPNTWVTANLICTTSSTDIYGTVNNYIEFTGLQFEKGSIATPFEFRPYKLEMELCQRYYEKSFTPITAPAPNVSAEWTMLLTNPTSVAWQMVGYIPFKIPKRSGSGTATLYTAYGGSGSNTVLRVPGGSVDGAINTIATNTNGIIVTMSNATAYSYHTNYTCDCEL